MDRKKFLFISLEASIQDTAWSVLNEGHEVKYFIEEASQKEIGDGFLPKSEDWQKDAAWADVIVFDDVSGFGAKAKKLREEGKLVIGGTPYTDRLEDDRAFGQDELMKAGVSVIPHENFVSFDDAIKFVKEHPDKYVIKPSGDAQKIKHLLFVGEEEDGKDVLQILEDYKKVWGKKIKEFQLQKKISGVEIAVGAFFNGKEFVYPINVNFEHKKLFPGNLGPSTGEMGTSMFWSPANKLFNLTLKKMEPKLKEEGYCGYIDINCIVNSNGIYPLEFTCFDEQTEILTKEGWKNYSDVNNGDFTLAINPQTREIDWKEIVNKAVIDYDGKMVKLGAANKKHSALDALVTPEHNLFISNSGSLKFCKAGSIPLHETKIIRTGTYAGFDLQTIEIPAHNEEHSLGRHCKTMQIVHQARTINTSAFMEFLGLYLAEGSIGKHGYLVSIAQSPSGSKRKQIEQVLENFGFKFAVQKNGAYQINSVQLCRFLDYIGLAGTIAGNKFIPAELKNLAPKYLKSLIYGFALGDGNWHGRTGQLTLATTSKKLADDLQEIIIKCGEVANILTRKAKGTKGIGGYLRNNDLYVLSFREKKKDYSLDKRVISEEHYSGKIWDVEVADWHTLLVRRNGKPFFSGNCRFGYPTISIQQEGILNPMGEFLYDLARGENPKLRTKSGFQVGVLIVVPPFPFKDKNTFEVYSKDAVIVFKKNTLEGVHIADVKKVNGNWLVTGDSGWALVVVGTGQTMVQAQKQVYSRIRNILIPNMYYRKDIGDRWFEDSDKLQNWGYLRE